MDEVTIKTIVKEAVAMHCALDHNPAEIKRRATWESNMETKMDKILAFFEGMTSVQKFVWKTGAAIGSISAIVWAWVEIYKDGRK